MDIYEFDTLATRKRVTREQVGKGLRTNRFPEVETFETTKKVIFYIIF